MREEKKTLRLKYHSFCLQFALALWVTEVQVPLLFNQSYFLNASRRYFSK